MVIAVSRKGCHNFPQLMNDSKRVIYFAFRLKSSKMNQLEITLQGRPVQIKRDSFLDLYPSQRILSAQ